LIDDSLIAVKDELAIRNLLARLAILADEGKPQEYGALFADDAEWRMADVPGAARSFPTRHGRAAIVDALLERRATGEGGPGSQTRHGLLQSTVEVNGDEARARTYMVYLVDLNSVPRIQLAAVYNDRFARIGSVWKLQSRSIEKA
jgi:3-phenylpropionate/cinnamic acid dioxygenase small subunit